MARFMSGDGILHCMQYIAPPSFLVPHASHVQGPVLVFSPSRQSSKGLFAPSGFRAPQEMHVSLFLKFTVLQLGLGHCQSFGSYVFGLKRHIILLDRPITSPKAKPCHQGSLMHLRSNAPGFAVASRFPT